MTDAPANPVKNHDSEDASRDDAGRWRPGKTGNPRGRPPASAWVTKARANLRANVAPIIEAMQQRALAGDTAAARLLLERALPVLKAEGDAVRLPTPAGTLADQARGIMTQAAAGQLTPDAAGELLTALGAVARITEVAELEARIQALEAAAAARGTPP